MSYVQCLSSYPQQSYKLTHDVSLDSLNDIDNDIALSPEYKPFTASWTHTGPNNTVSGPGQIDNDFHISHVNANNVRNTEAHGQSTSWAASCRGNNGHVDECISDYISSRTPAHGNTACGTEHFDRQSGASNVACKTRRREEVHNLIDSDDLSATRRRHRTSSRSRSSGSNSPEVTRRFVSAAQTQSINGGPSPELDVGPDCPRTQEEGDFYQRRNTPQRSLDEELAIATQQRLSNKSSPEDDHAPSRSFSRQDSRASDSSYSDENCRRQSEDGSDGCQSQRSVRAAGRRTPRKGRRPRKLPEIPSSAKATAATITFMTASGALKSCSLTQLSNLLTEVRDNKEKDDKSLIETQTIRGKLCSGGNKSKLRETEFLQRSLSSVDRSLADELSEADPSLKLTSDIAPPTCPRSDESSPDSNVEFEQPCARNRHSSGGSQRSTASKTESERDIMSMSTSTIGSQGDSEVKVRAEESARETLLKRDSRDYDVNCMDDVPSSPRRTPQRAAPRHLDESFMSGSQRGGGAGAGANGGNDGVFREDFSLDEKHRTKQQSRPIRAESFDIATADRRSSICSSLSLGVEDLDATHRGCHKFIPRHSDELFIEIGDPIAVQCEDDDLWCAGYNLRTTKYGIFPSAYATDLSILELDDGSMRPIKFILRFLGSVEVSCHRGTEVLAQAINKVALSRRQTLNAKPAPVVLLEINEQGVKMSERTKKKEKVSEGSDIPMSPSKRAASIRARLAKIMSKEKDKSLDHFFTLKNISFCGYHPRNERYFAFITKHPLEMRFACHVFLGEHSTKTIAEAVGTAFRQFYSQYMAFVHPTEDIYIE